MVNGLVKWSEFFRNFSDKYILIGGAACHLLEDEYGQEPRATKDLDLVLIVEALSTDFVRTLWQFIKEGGYENRQRGENKKKHEFYRFSKPSDSSYPKQLELFARKYGVIELPNNAHLEPIPVGEDVSSLSAILMDDDYYNFTITHSNTLGDVHIANPEALICLKAKAYLEMTARKADGGNVDADDIEKHKKDIFRLAIMLPADTVITLPERLHEDLTKFVSIMDILPNADYLKSAGLSTFTAERILEQLKKNFII